MLGFLPWLHRRSNSFDAESRCSYNNETLEGPWTRSTEVRSTGGCRIWTRMSMDRALFNKNV